MALKKSELYSSLWSSCDELRGGMDASQYKDYVLVLLFIKYISDRYAGVPYAPISIPEGASFKDMVALKGKPDIGDQINKKIIGPLANANKVSDMPDFNEPAKLGSGKEIVERLTNLIAIFENPPLDFSKNRAEGDDILGDAYEYLMRHFATESGKSKGQFYTPAEVSRIIAQILGIRSAKTSSDTTVYDPTCGSGSLLLKVADEARTKVTLYGQEKDAAPSGLARMNMILHDNATASIVQGNTLANPKFTEGGTLKTFDYVVANPPFSDKSWSTGLDPLHDSYGRFQPLGTPPKKQGDYAYLLHIVRSLKNVGKGVVKMEIPDKIIVRPGDILICVRNGSRDLIGKCALIDQRARGMTFGAFMAIFRSSFNNIVYHQFKSQLIKRQIHQHLGATINQITNKSLNSFVIPLPPTKAEQEAISTILSDMDAEIEALEAKVAKVRQIKQGMMQELLTGRTRLI